MDKKTTADKIREANLEQWIDRLCDWKWWAITAVLLVMFYPQFFPLIAAVALISIARSLCIMARDRKPKADFTATEDGDVKQEKK